MDARVHSTGAAVLLALLALAGGCARTAGPAGTATAARGDVDALLAGWPPTPRQVAQTMIGKYGPPHEATPAMLVWNNVGPWKHTILSREETPHDFPRSHTDLLEQAIDYRVPPDRFDELAAYDGSVIVERTRGELSARCDKEEMNFLALNLAHDVVTGRRTVQDARRFYAQTAAAFMRGERPPYTQRLQFQVARGGTGDRDVPVNP